MPLTPVWVTEDIQDDTLVILSIAKWAIFVQELLLLHLVLRQQGHETTCFLKIAAHGKFDLNLKFPVFDMLIEHVCTASILHIWIQLNLAD